MGMMCDVAIWNPSDPEKPCQCGQLINDGPLGLTDTSVPDVAGYMEVIQLRAMQPPADFEGLSYTMYDLFAGYFRLIVNYSTSFPSELTVYYTQSAPSSLRLLPVSSAQPAKCVSSATLMLCDVAVWDPNNSDMPCQCGEIVEGETLGLTDTSVPDTVGFVEVIQLIPMPPPDVEPGHASFQSFWMTPEVYRLILNGEIIPASFARSAAVQAAAGVNLDRAIVKEACATTCFGLHYNGAALSHQTCRCLEDPSSVSSQQQYVAGDDLVSLINFAKYQPKPDGSSSTITLQVPGTRYGRFLFGNAVLPCGFTSQNVDPSTGPPGSWKDAGERTGLRDCASECSKLQLNFGAMLPLGKNIFKCWCAESVDMSAFSTAMPEVGGRAQILDFTDVIRGISSSRLQIRHVHGR
ncbi:hypothetical protein FJT64_020087 [Amphibalanus amphitrite]|uniref:Uncharacterized protein n=1 Tax=Amphibalanus amphitrite TaxID=1232801 RepID=A0A6A4WTY4_AMPAM|nr:hypothetical protein FJT64_020087 [Amphibalanus amphitrite]